MDALAWAFARPIAHRGLHDGRAGVYENTLQAAEAAIAGGYGIECDIQLSSDGEAMVFHDHGLERLTEAQGDVRERTAADLSRLRVGESSDTIPTLAGFLAVVAQRTPVVIEVKSRFDGDERLARRLVQIVAERDDPILVKSFDPEIVSLLRRIAPSLPRGIVAQSLYGERERASLGDGRAREMTDLLHWDRTEPNFLSWREADLPGAAPYLGRRLGTVPLMTWTIRSEADRQRVRDHADQIVFEGFTPARHLRDEDGPRGARQSS